MGAAALKPLLTAIKHKDKNVRIGAINALANIGDPNALDALTKAMGDRVAAVRTLVPMALGNSAALLRFQNKGSLAPIGQAVGVLLPALEKAERDVDKAMRDQIVMTLILLSGEDYGHDIIRWKIWAEQLSNAVVNQVLSSTDI